jgi:hypothetical protein
MKYRRTETIRSEEMGGVFGVEDPERRRDLDVLLSEVGIEGVKVSERPSNLVQEIGESQDLTPREGVQGHRWIRRLTEVMGCEGICLGGERREWVMVEYILHGRVEEEKGRGSWRLI